MFIEEDDGIIRGVVADIIDKYTLVINKGELDGVEEGMEFIVYEIGETIYDPTTKKSLGKIELVKGKVEISNVQEEMSTAVSNSLNYTGNFQFRFKLNVYGNVSDAEDSSPIMVGDLVRLV